MSYNINMGYHLKEIQKGKYGEFSKIKEEFLEAEDAYEQQNNIMLLVELSDLIGAIDVYLENFNMTLEDLIVMKNATKRAFKSGKRK
jgi:phosphoribosyl-ATP pyrophosphohydrolase